MAERVGKIEARGVRPELRVVEPEGVPLCDWGSEDLMLEHGRGSEAAFVELVTRHEKGIANYIYRMVQNRQIAEELTQEVFLALVKNAGRYRPTAKFTTYLYTIASNMVSKEWLRRKRRPKVFSLFASRRRQDGDDGYEPMDNISDSRADTRSSQNSREADLSPHRPAASPLAHTPR